MVAGAVVGQIRCDVGVAVPARLRIGRSDEQADRDILLGLDVDRDRIADGRASGRNGHRLLSAERQESDHTSGEGGSANARPDAGLAEYHRAGAEGVVEANAHALARKGDARNHTQGGIGDPGVSKSLLRCRPCGDPGVVGVLGTSPRGQQCRNSRRQTEAQ